MAETPVKDQATAPAEQKQPFVVSAPGHYPEAPIWTDWILFGVGWICGIAWLIGALVPLCRRPRFPATRNKAGWIANVIGSILLIVLVIIAIVVAAKHKNSASEDYNVCCSTWSCWYC